MRTKIDYISFSLEVRPREVGSDDAWWGRVVSWFFDLPLMHTLQFDKLGFTTSVPMKPYSRSIKRTDGGVHIHGNPSLPHITVQVSGAGCDTLIEDGTLYEFLELVHHRVTRLDIASDIETDTRPSEFAAHRRETRIKSAGFQTSPTGETVYLGSRQSERFARIYRYDGDHPRAHLLRVEFELKRLNARAAVQELLSSGESAVAAYLGGVFGLAHDLWRPDRIDGVEVRPTPPERRGTPKLSWLNKQVAPTIRELHITGAFDAREWLESIISS